MATRCTCTWVRVLIAGLDALLLRSGPDPVCTFPHGDED